MLISSGSQQGLTVIDAELEGQIKWLAVIAWELLLPQFGCIISEYASAASWHASYSAPAAGSCKQTGYLACAIACARPGLLCMPPILCRQRADSRLGPAGLHDCEIE